MRGGVSGGKMKLFCRALAALSALVGFKNIIILSSSGSPVKRGRESNREIPEVYAYVNDFLHKGTIEKKGKTFYEHHNIRQFGYWIAEAKKKPHQELNELGGAGKAKKLMLFFNKVDIPVYLYVIFTTGSVDFVGGYTYYTFLKTHLASCDALEGKTLSKVPMEETTGEEIHDKLFKDGKLKTPGHWK